MGVQQLHIGNDDKVVHDQRRDRNHEAGKDHPPQRFAPRKIQLTDGKAGAGPHKDHKKGDPDRDDGRVQIPDRQVRILDVEDVVF